MEPKKKSKTSKQISQRDYPPEIENLWKNFKILFDKRHELDSNFSFHKIKMAIEIDELLDKGNSLAASTIKNYYLRKTTTRKKACVCYDGNSA